MCRTAAVVLRVGVVCVIVALRVSAQPDTVRAQIENLLTYTGVEHPPAADVGRMAELWTRAQQPGITPDERRLAFRDLWIIYSRLQGRDVGDRPQTLDGFARFAAATFDAGGRMDLALPEPRGPLAGHHLDVDTRGSGPTPLLLISDLGVDGRQLYASFVQRQASAYTMHIVTLPYAGRARPLPWPETLDFTKRAWLGQIERELLALVDAPRMKGVTAIGTSGGGYFAARLALERPRQVRAAVLVHALVNTSMRATSDPDAPAPLAERLARVKASPPAPQLIPVAPVPAGEELRRRIDDPASTHPTARNWMAFAVKDAAVSRAWTYEALSTGFLIPSLQYGRELMSTDLGEDLEGLTVPMLAMGTWHDEESPVSNTPSVSQWEEISLRYPTIPLTIATFADTRAYVSADAPAEFDRALADFLAGRPVRGKPEYTRPRTSPRASVTQAIGGGEIAIAYGRPAVKARQIWGALVPYGRVWRAGANEATTFVVNRNVTVQGHSLAAGTYTFFVIPGEIEWTAIFNRVPRQWGAFDYNPAFDALRVSVKPAETPHHELLEYTIQPIAPNAATVALAWEKRTIALKVEMP